ncbi:oxygen-independent coproporphyrinogen III oxidase [Marinovum sp. 2_MG-2023]|uniref:oxygen-independent coproporphyrinogen III oxidase n=1 Tax=unclassified Marinovum TaxID=2647166 RepID=UPI0026E37697|nr:MULTISPECIES: oxygen-independent coproporphyrinogen III oxidase [unclassified Marinovum]MDO6728786.1 oxygen-independent coproporphyrinogen III oxidase [Marinovum sp. 2_MG-2023]MDO6777798.1 oxygen-independent coproporphyrinogen III oxidase [Marinovum sp. 1_MG-2023]
MNIPEQLRKHGLFDARVPRYTSYPPANHFRPGEGHRHQSDWLNAVPAGSEISVYIHIPFCKRLCFFCACRTQGTKTLRPVDAYVEVLRREIANVRKFLPSGVKMARLHLGGGTPTILSPATMALLLDEVFAAFAPTTDIEFSVEIDPTEAAPELLATLVDFGLNRASIGVQDFAADVQDAIGRHQSFEQTERVIQQLRGLGVDNINLDLLYGLPHQTSDSFAATLQQVLSLCPDRLAIYGYAHVPWMSKRQVMIDAASLPDTYARFDLAKLAQQAFVSAGYDEIGIDHFALPSDGLAIAARAGRLRRNFQGYTDDTTPTLVGLGASAISRFPQGYSQNAAATSAYLDRIANSGLAGHNGYEMQPQDILTARVIEDLMCCFGFRETRLLADFPEEREAIHATGIALMRQFPDAFFIAKGGLQIREDFKPLVRVIASRVDGFLAQTLAHASAI